MKTKSRSKIRIFLVDDHPVVREGVTSFLAGTGAMAVVGEAGNDREAMRKIKKAAPDVIILDVNLPGLDGGELSRRLRAAVPSAKIIAFSFHDGQEYVVRMARCGVHGYVMKDAPTAKLLEAIRVVHEGGLCFPSGMADAILSPDVKPSSQDTKTALTSREREVLVLLSEGLANKEVARRLGISVRTAETHREHLSRKLGFASIAELTKYAIQQGLTPLRSPETSR